MYENILYLTIIGSILYVYIAFALGSLAMRYSYRHHWIAWIPIVNLFLFPVIAKKKWQYGFIFFIPLTTLLLFVAQGAIFNMIIVVGISIAIAFFIYCMWLIYERRGFHGAYSLIIILMFVPFWDIIINSFSITLTIKLVILTIALLANLVLFGILAWGREKSIFGVNEEFRKTEKVKAKKSKKTSKRKKNTLRKKRKRVKIEQENSLKE